MAPISLDCGPNPAPKDLAGSHKVHVIDLRPVLGDGLLQLIKILVGPAAYLPL